MNIHFNKDELSQLQIALEDAIHVQWFCDLTRPEKGYGYRLANSKRLLAKIKEAQNQSEIQTAPITTSPVKDKDKALYAQRRGTCEACGIHTWVVPVQGGYLCDACWNNKI